MSADPTFDELSNQRSAALMFEAISGSRAYGLARADSDLDLRGVFALPAARYLGLVAPPNQLNDERNNTVYYSLRRTLELLAVGNPSMIELLYTPEDCVRVITPAWAHLCAYRDEFISERSALALIGYAQGQVKKARGQNKWINQPQPEAAPLPIDHCYYIRSDPAGNSSRAPFRPQPLASSGIDLAHHHVSRVEHSHGLFRLYHYGRSAKGVFRNGQLCCESIPQADEYTRYAGLLLYNEQGFNRALVDHQNYWTWREQRNESRWQQVESGQLDYDAKNLMHTLRLLYSARCMISDGRPLVRVSDELRDELLAVRDGRHSFEVLQAQAQQLIAECNDALSSSPLRLSCPDDLADRLLRECTELWEQ